MLDPQILPNLANGLDKRKAFYIPNSPSNFTDYKIIITQVSLNEFFDHVCDMGDYLNSRTEIEPFSLALQDGFINSTGCDAITPAGCPVCVALIMTQIQIGFGTVICYENLSMLIRTHRTRIYIKVRVEFAHPHRKTPRLQKSAQRCCCNTFSKRRSHAAGYEYEPGRHVALLPPLAATYPVNERVVRLAPDY